MNVTFDTNCLIDLEEERSPAVHLRRIIAAARAGRLVVRTVAISASERRPDGTYAKNFAEFQEKLANVGLSDFEILPPLWFLDVTFLDWCLVAGDQHVAEAHRIHSVLFPNSPFDYGEYCAAAGLDRDGSPIARKWLNRLCDTLAIWSHFHHGAGVFVTSDENFLKGTKRPQLIEIGAGDILRPHEAAALYAIE